MILLLFAALAFSNSESDLKSKKVLEMFYSYQKKFRSVPVMKADELKKQSKVVIVDVRSKKERIVSKIPSSITLDQLEANIEKYRDRPIVTYCTIGYRSGKAAQRLRKSYGLNVYNLEGSILYWVHQGLPLEDSSGKVVKKLHVYGDKWNILPDGYQSTY